MTGRRSQGGLSGPARIANSAGFPTWERAGGDWELAGPEVRPQKNVLFEFAGTDPHSGSIDYAVKELGIDRITWGGHGPSRSFATELGKVLDATLSMPERMKILGGNIRRITSPIFRRKGKAITL